MLPLKLAAKRANKEDAMTIIPADVRECLTFLGTVKASYKELVEAFGKPKAGDGYKTEAEWDAELIPGCFV